MFSAPLWLFGLVALAIPLILHLWSRRPRQVIRVGTLRHVELTADARSWSARLTEPLLLALRLALLTTLVFALAGLRLPARRAAGSGRTIVLVDPALLSGSSRSTFLDSIAREREPVRLLSRGLPKYQLDGMPGDTRAMAASSDLWGPIAEAGEVVGPRGTIHVVARPRLAALSGTRPHLRAKVEWHVPEAAAAGYALGIAKCDDCPKPAARAVMLLATDSVAERRLAVAVRAIADELALVVQVVTTVDSADAIITDRGLSDSLLAAGVSIVTLSPASVASAFLADSLWAHWPWPSVAGDSLDQRQVSVAQALPALPAAALAPLGDPEAARRGLLLLALLLFVLERWLATRPGRNEV